VTDSTAASPVSVSATPVSGNVSAGWGGYSPAVVVLALVLILCVAPPLVFLVTASLHETNFDGSMGAFTTEHYQNLLGGARFFRNLTTSLLFSVGSAIIALTIGGLQAWIVERTNTPGRQYVLGLAIVSIGIPTVVYTVSFLLILGNTGPLNQLLMYLFGASKPIFNVYSLGGMILIEGIELSPLCFLLLSAVFRNNDPALEEAALMAGANIWQILHRIALRLALPGILALLILTFIRAIGSFETPALVGRPGRVNVLTTDIYGTLQSSPPDYGESGAFSVILLIIVAMLLYAYSYTARNAARFQTVSGKGFRPRTVDLGPWRWVTLGILAFFFMLTMVLPVAMLVWVSFQPFYEGISIAAFNLVTLRHYGNVLMSESLREAVVNTLLLGAATSVLVVAFTAVCAWLVTRRFKGAWILDQLCSAPLIFPGIVLAVAMMEIVLNLPVPLYGTLLSIIIASAINYLPYGMRYSYAGILQIHRELEEAGSMSGARAAIIFLRIVVPLVAPALIAGGLFVFLVSVKAVSIPILLSGPNSRVVSVAIFDMWQNGLMGELSAIGVIWSIFMMGVSLFLFFFIKRFGLAVR
jgi:iron(III) transport system permease protein